MPAGPATPPGDAGAPPAGGPGATVEGTLDLRYVNATGSPQAELYLRLYANHEQYGEGGIALRDVAVDGAPVAPELSVDDTVARLPLPAPLPPGGAATVRMAFTTTAATAEGPLSHLNVDPETGTVALAHWYPILAGYDPATGWVLDPIPWAADIVVADAALYDVALAAPAGLSVVATGVRVAETDLGEQTRHAFVTGPVRQFAAVADADFVAVSREVAGVTVTAYANPGREAGAARMADYAGGALAIFGELFGPYPYAELDVVEWRMPPGIAAVELPTLIGVDPLFHEDPEALVVEGFSRDLAEAVVAHEVAHQWWYGLVGSNFYAHAFRPRQDIRERGGSDRWPIRSGADDDTRRRADLKASQRQT